MGGAHHCKEVRKKKIPYSINPSGKSPPCSLYNDSRNEPQIMHFSALKKHPPKKHFLSTQKSTEPAVRLLPQGSTFLQRFSVLSSSMSPQLLSVLVLLSSVFSAWCIPLCHDQCCRFVEEFPVRVQRLREDYRRIRGFYVSSLPSISVRCSIIGALEIDAWCCALVASAGKRFSTQHVFVSPGIKRWLGQRTVGPERRGRL